MPDETIPPALTPDEWRLLAPRVDYHRGADGELVTETQHTTGRVRANFADEMHAGMALHNAALPDGDPRKIIQADVDALDAAENEAAIRQDWDACEILQRLAAKLAPLLRPRDA